MILKSLSDVKIGDPVWVVVSGLIDRYHSSIILYPSIVKLEVTGKNYDKKFDNEAGNVITSSPVSNNLPYKFPTSYKICYDQDNPFLLAGYAWSEYHDSDGYNDVYMGEDVYDLDFCCLFNIKDAKKKLLEEKQYQEKIIKSKIKSHREECRRLYKNLNSLNSTVDDTLHKINEEKRLNKSKEKK